MLFRFTVAAFALFAVSLLGCHRKPETGRSEAQCENVALRERVTPECYRFDVRLGEARVSPGPSTDNSTFCRRFDFMGDGAPWTVAEGSARCAIAESALAIEAETLCRCDSPVMTGVPSSGVHAVLIEARVSGCSEFALAWRSENGEFLAEDEVPIAVKRPGVWTPYMVDTAPLSGWNRLGSVGQLRLVLPAKAKIDVRSVGLAQNLDLFAGKSYGQTDYPLKREYVHSVFIRTPGSLEYDVTVMPNAWLNTAFIHRDRSPVRFRILLRDGPDQTVLAEGREEDANVRHKVAVDLSRWAGKNIQMRFESDSDKPGTVALWCNPTMARAYPVNEAKRPVNVIWYVIDCLRATNVSAYGYERKTTPTIDAVAKEGVRFEWCFSPGAWTIDSVTSFFTGLSPNAHGMYRTHLRVPDSMHLLPEILRGAGYATALFTQNPYLSERRGFVRGFDEAHQFRVRDTRGRRDATPDNYALNAGIAEYLKEHREGPVFLYVHSIEPHHPYVPPGNLRVFTQPDGSVKETDIYDDCILWADGNLGHTIEKLKEEGLWNDTLLIISADHGQCFPEYDSGLGGHGDAPYLSRVRIPLVMRLPGIMPEGVTIRQNVQALDIPSTLFELLHVEPDPQFGGWSLLGLLNGSKKDEFAQRSIYPSGERSKWQAVVKDRWFFLDNDGKGELLDLQEDPRQNANVIQKHPDLARRLLDETVAFRESELEKAKEYDTQTLRNEEENPEDRRDLEALGYLDAFRSGGK
jgi:arylsulfatase A-like enzyme